MTQNEFERRIAELRAAPLCLLCRTPTGEKRIMTPQECRRTGSVYIHIVANDLDELLSAELGMGE